MSAFMASRSRRRSCGPPPGWNCRDVRLYLARLSFDQLGQERAAALNTIETRFKLPPDQVDMLINAGRDALKTNPVFRSFLKRLRHGANLSGRFPSFHNILSGHVVISKRKISTQGRRPKGARIWTKEGAVNFHLH